MWKWIVIAIVVIAASLLAFPTRMYKRLFSLEHYREVANSLENLRSVAGESILPDDDTRSDFSPESVLTSKFLNISYSIHEMDEYFEHHISVSTPRQGFTTHAAGQTFVSFFVWRMRIDPRACVSYKGPAAYHLVFGVEEEKQPDFLRQPLGLPEDISHDAVIEHVQSVRQMIDFQDMTRSIEEAQEATGNG
jgi:hypothetical protein